MRLRNNQLGLIRKSLFQLLKHCDQMATFLSNIWQFTTVRIYPKAWKFAKSDSKFCQIVYESSQNGQSFLTSWQSGKISSNLVALCSKYVRNIKAQQLTTAASAIVIYIIRPIVTKFGLRLGQSWKTHLYLGSNICIRYFCT